MPIRSIAAALAFSALAPSLAPSLAFGGDAPDFQSVGALEFGPQGVLFVADPQAATIYALETADTEAPEGERGLDVEKIDAKLAYMLGTTPDEIRIHDLAVNPLSRAAYLSLTRGGGDGAQHAIVRVESSEKVELLDFEELGFMAFPIDNAPQPDESGPRSKRTQSITDMVFHEGFLYVAGLSNEEFASKLRALEFPFENAGPRASTGTSIEVYHASHDAWETRSPVRAFVPIDIAGDPHLLCGYTCTPLVKVPIEGIRAAKKFTGTTVAELGNRNTPLDMVVYEKGGERFVLIANTSRGVMKLPTAGIEGAEGMTELVREPAGMGYETIAALANVTQLAPLDGEHALVLIEAEGGSSLERIELP